MKLHVSAIVKSKSEFLEEVKVALENLVQETRKEEASITYDLHQSIENENVFVFYEIWADQPGLDKHNESAHMQEFVAQIANKLQEPVQIYVTHRL